MAESEIKIEIVSNASSPNVKGQDTQSEEFQAIRAFNTLLDEITSKWKQDVEQLYSKFNLNFVPTLLRNVSLQQQIQQMNQEFNRQRRKDQLTISNLHSLVARLQGQLRMYQTYQSMQIIGLPTEGIPIYEQPLPGLPNNSA